MRVNYNAKNFVATALDDVARDPNRTYLCVVAEGDVGVTISGGQPFTVPAGTHWAPIPAPMNDIAFTGTGTLIVG